jgi:hypothetical protein
LPGQHQVDAASAARSAACACRYRRDAAVAALWLALDLADVLHAEALTVPQYTPSVQ